MTARSRTIVNANSTVTGALTYLGYLRTGAVQVLGYPTSSITYQSDIWTVDDVVTDNWRSIIQKGGIINNPYYMGRTQTTLYPANLTHTFFETCNQGSYEKWVYTGTEAWDFRGLFPVTVDGLKSDGDTLSRFAYVKAKAKDLSDLSVLASLGELDETVGMLVGGYKKLKKTLFSLKRRWGPLFLELLRGHSNYRKVSTVVKRSVSQTEWMAMLRDVWLTWRYGIRPLMFEIRSYYDFINEGMKRRGLDRITNRAYQKAPPVNSVESYRKTLYPTAGMNLSYDKMTTLSMQASAGVLYQLEAFNLFIAIGATPDQIPATIWELTKLSFVLDWFLNVGPVIGALVPHAGLRELAAWRTYKFVETMNIVCTGSDGGSPVNIACRLSDPSWASGLLATRVTTVKYRLPATLSNSLILGPLPEIRLGYQKIADLCALTTQILASSKKGR